MHICSLHYQRRKRLRDNVNTVYNIIGLKSCAFIREGTNGGGDMNHRCGGAEVRVWGGRTRRKGAISTPSQDQVTLHLRQRELEILDSKSVEAFIKICNQVSLGMELVASD
jgi:hypothetical protein